jgi:hypothetical protein
MNVDDSEVLMRPLVVEIAGWLNQVISLYWFLSTTLSSSIYVSVARTPMECVRLTHRDV